MASSRQKNPHKEQTSSQKVRIDKWLWAARFFKTRSLASDAVKSGKIHIDGDRIKPSRELQIGDELTIKQGFIEKTVRVKVLSSKRGPAAQAALLYEETPQSLQKREELKVMKLAQPALRSSGLGRPTKRERRKIIEFTKQ